MQNKLIVNHKEKLNPFLAVYIYWNTPVVDSYPSSTSYCTHWMIFEQSTGAFDYLLKI